jgi:hypothetical protein
MHEPRSRDANSSVVGEDEIVNYVEGTVLANGGHALTINTRNPTEQ